MRICVVGLGKIGLPLAAQYTGKGFEVVGCDINPQVVDSINRGVSHIKEEPGLEEKIKFAHEKNLLITTTKTTEAVKKCDVVVLIVPLVVDENKRIKYTGLESATRQVGNGLQKNTLVIFETTLPVGDTRNKLVPILEKESKLKAGRDFYVVFSPERVASGTIFLDLKRYPKVVGGINEESTKKGVSFYKKVLDAEVLPVKNTETAETIKLFGMTYRDVNIALANEYAKFCKAKGINALEAINGANTIPHTHILFPGCGVGGHCAPVYPYFLIEKAAELGVDMTLPKSARAVNDSMPIHTVNLLEKNFGKLNGKNILVLGLSYRGGVKEKQFSPSLSIISELKKRKAQVYLNDPLFSKEEIKKLGVIPFQMDDKEKIDAVILATNHAEYKKLDFAKFKRMGVKVLVDGRNFLDKKNIASFGIIYESI